MSDTIDEKNEELQEEDSVLTPTGPYVDDGKLGDMLPSVKDYLEYNTVFGAFELLNVKNRVIYLNTIIDEDTVQMPIQMIRRFNREDYGIPPEERRPIILRIANCGGNVDDAFNLIDTILLSKTPVYTVNDGYAYSAAGYILVSGHKRFCTPHSFMLIHDGESTMGGSTSKVKDAAENIDKIDRMIRKYMLDHTKITRAKYDKMLRKEWFLDAAEQRKCGCIDYVLGEDCDIDVLIK